MKSRRILFITPDNREVENLTPTLEELGYEWKHIRFAEDLGDFLGSFQPDLVILNALMPRTNVTDVLQELREASNAKLIVTSAVNSITMLFKARHRWKVDEFVPLPVPIAKMAQLVAFLLGDNKKRPYIRGYGEIMQFEKPTTEVRPAAAKIPLAGDLREVRLGRLLGTIIRKQMAGVLVLGEGTSTREVLIADGRVLEVRSNYLKDIGLGDILVRERHLDRAQLTPLLHEATRQGLRLGELLRAQQLVERGNLNDALNQQVVEKLAEVFNWESGRYRFEKDEDLPTVTEPRDLLLAKVAFQAARFAATERHFQRLFERWLDEPMALNPAAPVRANQVELTNDEKRFVFSLNGDKTLRRAIAESLLPEKTTKTILTAMYHLRMLTRAS